MNPLSSGSEAVSPVSGLAVVYGSLLNEALVLFERESLDDVVNVGRNDMVGMVSGFHSSRPVKFHELERP